MTSLITSLTKLSLQVGHVPEKGLFLTGLQVPVLGVEVFRTARVKGSFRSITTQRIDGGHLFPPAGSLDLEAE